MEGKLARRIGIAAMVVVPGVVAGSGVAGELSSAASRFVGELGQNRSETFLGTCDGIVAWNDIQKAVKEDLKNNPDRSGFDSPQGADVAAYIDRYNQIKKCQ